MSKDNDKELSDVKMKTTGLGAIMGHIQQNIETIEKETKPDPTSSWTSNIPLEQLCDIGHGLPKSFRSQRISSYYCETCEVDLNSEVTYNTHITGAKHKKKEKNKQMMSERGLEVTGVNDSQSLAPPKAKKSKKAAIDFRELVRESMEPVIGLHYVIEIFPEDSSGDNDAMYSCTLCCCDSTAASMFAHIKGYKHREKYLGMKYNFVSEDKKAILAEARRVESREGRRLDEVDTIFDDYKYPWPIGRKPAHLEAASSAERRRSISQERLDPGEGSDTLSKEFSRRGYNFSKHRQEDNKVKLMNSTVAQVLESLQASQVKDEDDAEMAHQVAAHLIKALIEYKQLTVDPLDAKYIKLKSDNILELLHGIVSVRSTSSITHRSRGEDFRGNIVDYGHGSTSNSSYSDNVYKGHISSDSERRTHLNPTSAALYGEEIFSRQNNTRTSAAAAPSGRGGERLNEEEEEYRRYLNRMSAERNSSSVLMDRNRSPMESMRVHVGPRGYSIDEESPYGNGSNGRTSNSGPVRPSAARGFTATLPTYSSSNSRSNDEDRNPLFSRNFNDNW